MDYTQATFVGTLDYTYTFRIQATDNVNNTTANWQVSQAVAVHGVTKYYTHGGSRVAMRRGDALYYLNGDHPSTSLRTGLGSTSLTTDESGAPISEVRYLPYGEERWTDGASPTDFTFTGQRNEAGFGLMDYNARYYNPRLGRFVSPDTVVPEPTSSGGFNRYRYTRNNPLKYADPSGHCEWDICATIRDLVVDIQEWLILNNPCPVNGCFTVPDVKPELPEPEDAMGPLLVDGGEGENLRQVNGAIEWGASLAPLVSQFEEVWGPNINLGRNEGVPYTGKDRQVSTGEQFKDVIYGQHGDLETKYLWTIDKEGVKIAPELTPFDTGRGNIVHTNLSPNGAFAGGEMWFLSDDEIVINAGSGRYGYNRNASPEQQAEASQRYGTAVKIF